MNKYEITVTDSTAAEKFYQAQYTGDMTPYHLLDRLGEKYAPCIVKCDNKTEGWFLEKEWA